MKSGIIVLTAFEGDVKISTSSSDQSVSAAKGTILKPGHILITGSNSKASLAFENGIVMEVAPSSKFVIQEFQQAPWDYSAEKLAEMKTEPSKSKTTGFLEYGEVITGVKTLNLGSTLDVSTPLGSAQICGTDFKTGAARNSDGSPKSFTVGVASGVVQVQSAGGGQTVSVPAGTSSTVSVGTSQSGQPNGISQPTTNQLSSQDGGRILSTVSFQRSEGQPVFAQALARAASSSQSVLSNLSPDQQKALTDAAAKGAPDILGAVNELVTQVPLAAPDIAAAATELFPSVASEIAYAASFINPSMAPEIAAAVATIVPSSAPSIASVVTQAVPSAAAAIAGSVAKVAPSLAPQIGVAVATVVPEAAAEIAQSVSKVQPQQANLIANRIIEEVAGVDRQAVGDASRSGAQQAGSTGSTIQPPPPPSLNSNNQQIPPTTSTSNSTLTTSSPTPPPVTSPQ
ncbi:MAG: hypothetical protein WCG66_09210 [bacterium]